jgi:DNA (cytosine-5)-methyltransferase 1
MSSLPDFVHKSLTVKNPPDFKVISTFSGCGGSSTGYVWAGGKVLLAVEWDDNAVETYRLNYPDTPIYHGDIAKLTVDEALRLTGLNPGELDILDGSPPCQGFSTAGKRMIDDPRNQLFREYVRLLRGLRPKVFVMENVSGMVKGKMKLVFAEILRELKASGYVVSARLMNTMYFGVPQSRERLIFIGVREDLGIAPTHPRGTMRTVTVREAFRSVEIEDVPTPTGTVIAGYLPRVPKGGNMASLAGYGQDNLVRPRWDFPSPTVRKDAALTGYGCFIHPDIDRFLSTAEYKRLGSYPDSFRFAGSYIQAKMRIGNSVPPRFMQAIAEHIRNHILKVANDGRTP